MSLYAHSLLSEQATQVGLILKETSRDPYLARRTKAALEDHIARFDRTADFDEAKLRRIFKSGTLPRDGSLTALLYDFVVNDLILILKNMAGQKEGCGVLRKKILNLRTEVNERINNLDNPFTVLARDIDPEDLDKAVPKVFINRFFGYRRSSHGELVRFYLSIDFGPRRQRSIVRYHNFYWRGKHKWKISGSGIFSRNGVLYLFGHARDERSESTGYRILALRQLGTTNMVCGPLITMDEVEPISARVLLIPWGDHKLTQDQQKMKQQELIQYMCKTERNQVHTESYERFIDEIRENVQRCFPVRKDQGLFHYISNMTSDVLHCVPEDNDDLIREELRYRAMAYNSRHDIKSELALALKNHLDGKNRM